MNVRTAALAAAAVLIAGSALPAQDVVEIRLRGRYFSEPATVRLTVAVQPHERNRTLVIQADGDRLFRSSAMELAGENGKRLHTFEFKNLPAGHYTIRAEVHSSAQVRGAAEELLVVGDPGEQ